MKEYIALLRGINVGGHKKVRLPQLKQLLAQLGFQQTSTILNSGNAIFSSTIESSVQLQKTLSEAIKNEFGFEVPTIVLPAAEIQQLVALLPFSQEKIIATTRLYVTFLNGTTLNPPTLPYYNPEIGHRIIFATKTCVCSVVDISIARSPIAMAELQKFYGEEITTRNWNTIEKIAAKLS